MNFSDLTKSLNNEPKFRLQQINQALFSDLIDNWSTVSTLPKKLKEKLIQEFPLQIPAKIFINDKNTAKALIYLDDNSAIETVLMRHAQNRQTICLSTQVGCPLNCAFCATGQTGFQRNLTSDEIIIQVLFWARFLKKENKKINNLVFMGMGEPLLNYDATLNAIHLINHPDYFNIGARHISISTAGIIPGIKKLAQEKIQINLAISLHTLDNTLRSKLMPINKTYPITQVLSVVKEYLQKTHRQIMIEYLLIKGLNDRVEDALNLAQQLKKYLGKLFFVNLITFNPLPKNLLKNKTSGVGEWQAPTSATIKKFQQILTQHGIANGQRYRFGVDELSACGQLQGVVKKI